MISAIADFHVEFQSTHPRGVRPQLVTMRKATKLVSIHAPAWGATTAEELIQFFDNVSIHAPAWGAT
mgnify:CR=1 FL=1